MEKVSAQNGLLRLSPTFPFTHAHTRHQKYDATPQQWEQYYEEFGQWKENVDPRVVKILNQQRKKKGLKPFRTAKVFANSYAMYVPLLVFYSIPSPLSLPVRRFLKEYYTTTKAQGGEIEGIGSMAKSAAEKWRNMSDEEREVYKVKAADAKEEWQRTHGKAEGEV